MAQKEKSFCAILHLCSFPDVLLPHPALFLLHRGHRPFEKRKGG
jgi:hypothetical protein